MSVFDCERCGKPLLSSIPTRFIGGVHANLCSPCVNDIDGKIHNHPKWDDLLTLDAKLEHCEHRALARDPVPVAEIENLYKDREAVKMALRELILGLIRPQTASTTVND
jgi:hypothetical protein